MKLREITNKKEIKPFDWITLANGEKVQIMKWEDPVQYRTGESSKGKVFIEHYGHLYVKFPQTLGLEFF